ncbi:MAG: glucosamine-6-phosphate deaminase [Phycisphaeraceae bacterium]|nr:glucosamine-6-phosphate deaminase [Phycisphaeraceae bacterium]
MQISISPTPQQMGQKAAHHGATLIRQALAQHGRANIIVATGASQFPMLENLVTQPDIRWDHVTAFHLDEYVGLPLTHPASFRLYLWQRFASKLPLPLAAFHYLNAESNPAAEAQRVSQIIQHHPIDVAFIGIGENGHLAFNDPPADLQTQSPYIVVNLDDACRRQQLGEGWFPTFDAVPQQAISMSIAHILKSHAIIVTVPDQRKAEAVKNALEKPLTPQHPAASLKNHPAAFLYLDQAAASLLPPTIPRQP